MSELANAALTLRHRPPPSFSAEPVRDEVEMKVAITALAREGGGLIVAPEPFTITRRGLIVDQLVVSCLR
jgi:hypothetical protein